MLRDIAPIVDVGSEREGVETPSLAESKPMLEATASMAWIWAVTAAAATAAELGRAEGTPPDRARFLGGFFEFQL